MNTTHITSPGGIKKGFAALLSMVLLMSSVSSVHARVLFQDDDFHDIDSEGIIIDSDGAGANNTTLQFGNDAVPANNGTILWDVTADEFVIDNDIDLGGVFDAADTSRFSIRQVDFLGVFTGGGAPSCSVDGELAVDVGPTSENLYICTDSGNNTWTLVSTAAGDFLSAIASDIFGDAAGAQTLTIGDGTDADALTAAANSLIDFSAANQFVMRTEAADPGTCIEGELYYNTADNDLRVCTATDTWSTSGPQDFEDVYGVDADNTLSASADFTIETTTTLDLDATGALGIDSDAATTIGGASVGVTADGGTLDLTGDGTNDVNISNAGAAIDVDSATLDLDTTAGYDIAGGAASSVSTSAGDLTISGGGELLFDDGDFTDTVQLSDADTVWDTDFASVGLIDNINDIATQLGGDTISTFNFTEDNVLADDDTVYTALDKLDLRFGDLASTANGEGASLIGVEDADGDYTATDLEGVLAEIGDQIGPNAANVENILLYPEYPDTVLQQGGASSRGRMDSNVDGTEGSFYQWRTRQAADQTFDIITRIPVPEDFDAATNVIVRYRTGTAVAGENSVEVVGVFDHTGASCGSAAAAASVTFASHTIVPAVCTITAGEFIEIQTRVLADNTASAEANVGRIEFNYTN